MSDVCGQKFNTTETDEHKARRMQLRQTHLRAGSLRATRDAFLRANMVNTDTIGSIPSTSSKSQSAATAATGAPSIFRRMKDGRHTLFKFIVLTLSAQFSRIEE